jgi:hypothetical protein
MCVCHNSYPSVKKKGDALSPLLLILILKYIIRKVQEFQVGLTNQLLIYANDVNLLRDDIEKITKIYFTLVSMLVYK